MTNVDDVHAITSLIHEYARRLDDGDLDGVAALFADADVRSTRDDRVRRGAAAVRSLYDPVILYDDRTPRTLHQLTNVTIEVDVPTARARTYFTVLQVAGLGLHPILSGEYRDRFSLVDGRWEIAPGPAVR